MDKRKNISLKSILYWDLVIVTPVVTAAVLAWIFSIAGTLGMYQWLPPFQYAIIFWGILGISVPLLAILGRKLLALRVAAVVLGIPGLLIPLILGGMKGEYQRSNMAFNNRKQLNITCTGALKRRVTEVFRGLHLAAIVVLIVSLAACGAGGSKQQSAEYQKGYRFGLEAYIYGLPLMVTNATYMTMTSVNVSNGAYGPVNQFNNERGVNNAESKAVVAPGSTSLSSIAWLDLRDEPQVLQIPEVTDHYFVLALIDPYTENLKNFGTASNTKPGDYVIAGPGQHDVKLPPGTQRLNVDYSRIWIIGSTQLKGPDDVANVNKIQDGYTLTPLSKYGTNYTPPAHSQLETSVTKYQIPTGVQFFDALGQLLATYPPPARDDAMLRKLAEVGIGPGMIPSQDTKLSSDTLNGLTDAVAAGPAQIEKETQNLFAEGFAKNNGYLLGGFGQYGADYTLRAVISQIGLGAFVPNQAVYAMSWSDHSKKTLMGSTSYVLHMQDPPPTNEGWSLTVYDLHGALVSNPLNRYAFSNLSQLARNSDGSIDFYLQCTEPANQVQARNWLPTPCGQGFEVIWRLFAPEPSKIDGILNGSGWQPPAIQRGQ
jgi:hypothetical protein